MAKIIAEITEVGLPLKPYKASYNLNMLLEAEIETALASDETRVKLVRVVKRALEQGIEGSVLWGALEEAYRQLKTQGKVEQADEVLEVLDSLTGWCRPFPSRRGDEE